jgi:hypothetical protein
VCLSSGFCGFQSCQTAHGGSGGTFNESHTCTAEENSGTCNFHLEYHPDAVSNTIDHMIDDDDGVIQTTPEACTSSDDPHFTDSPNPSCDGCVNGDDMRLQTGYWGAAIGQTVATQRLWSQVTPDQQDWVHPHADITTTNCGSGNGVGACFFPWPSNTINVSATLSIQADVWQHEYGHYVVWTRGGSGPERRAAVV